MPILIKGSGGGIRYQSSRLYKTIDCICEDVDSLSSKLYIKNIPSTVVVDDIVSIHVIKVLSDKIDNFNDHQIISSYWCKDDNSGRSNIIAVGDGIKYITFAAMSYTRTPISKDGSYFVYENNYFKGRYSAAVTYLL